VDKYLRVKGYEGSIWACGDAAINEDGVVLPQLAQVARQQGIYLSKIFNGTQGEVEKEFKFFSLGSMAYVGDLKGIYDGTSVGEPGKEIKQPQITGLLALLMWRFAYWGRQTSWVNKMLIPMHWFKSFLFGRGKSSILPSLPIRQLTHVTSASTHSHLNDDLASWVFFPWTTIDISRF
jgi:NADH dehydrogenase FAD-containing subunit